MSPSQIQSSGWQARMGFQSSCGLYSRLQEPNAIRVTGCREFLRERRGGADEQREKQAAPGRASPYASTVTTADSVVKVSGRATANPCCRAMRANCPLLAQQFLESAVLDHLPGGEDDDLVHLRERGKPMRHADDGAVFLQAIDGRLDVGFRFARRARRSLHRE